MIRYIQFFIIGLILFCTTGCTDKSKTNTPDSNALVEQIQDKEKDDKISGYQYLLDFLRTKGYEFTEGDEGDEFIFKIDGHKFFAPKKNSSVLSIHCLYGVEDIPRNRLLERCNSMNQHFSVIKFSILDDSESLLCSYEFVPNKSTTTDEFNVIFMIIPECFKEFFKEFEQ